MPYEVRTFDKLAYVSSGAGHLDAGAGAGESQPLSEGDVLIVPAGARHRFRDRSRAPMTLHVVCVDWRRCRPGAGGATAWRMLRGLSMRPRNLPHAYQRAQTVRRVRGLVFEQTRRARHWALALPAQLEELLVAVLRALPGRQGARQRGRDDPMRATLVWLERHFHEPVRIPSLASMAAMSYRSYTAHFRVLVGRSVNQHVQGLRIDYAQKRLAAGSSIIDAALEAGFQDLSHFYRVFRRRCGTTPGRARGYTRPIPHIQRSEP